MKGNAFDARRFEPGSFQAPAVFQHAVEFRVHPKLYFSNEIGQGMYKNDYSSDVFSTTVKENNFSWV